MIQSTAFRKNNVKYLLIGEDILSESSFALDHSLDKWFRNIRADSSKNLTFQGFRNKSRRRETEVQRGRILFQHTQ